MALMLCLVQHLVSWSSLYVSGGEPFNECLVDEESASILFQFPSMNLRNWMELNLLLAKSSFLLFVNDCHVQALWAFMGPFGDYILSKFLLRDEVNFTVAVGLQTLISDQKIKIAFFAAVLFWSRFPSVSYSSSYKRTLFQAWLLVEIKGYNRILFQAHFIFKLRVVWWMLYCLR